MDWAKTTAKGIQETFKFWDSVRIIPEGLRYVPLLIDIIKLVDIVLARKDPMRYGW